MVKRKYLQSQGFILLFFCLLQAGLPLHAQEIIEEVNDSTFIISPEILLPEEIEAEEIEETDPILQEPALPDSTIREAFSEADSVFVINPPDLELKKINQFKPNSTKAVLYSAIFPGLGQIYNRQYWKLPLVYGGFMGFMYAITWNNRQYQDYYGAYKDIMDDYLNRQEDPDNWHDSWKAFFRAPSDGDYSSILNNETNRSSLKRKKDYFRRYRDLSIILAVGFYAICMIDSYVDAELFDFDISPDLTMRIEPMITPRTSYSPRTFGVNCSITF